MLKDINALTRKLQQVERNCMNKIKLMHHDSTKTTLGGKSATNTLRDAKNPDTSEAMIKQLKARIQNLEKSYDLSK